jgi:hypothetical protein
MQARGLSTDRGTTEQPDRFARYLRPVDWYTPVIEIGGLVDVSGIAAVRREHERIIIEFRPPGAAARSAKAAGIHWCQMSANTF